MSKERVAVYSSTWNKIQHGSACLSSDGHAGETEMRQNGISNLFSSSGEIKPRKAALVCAELASLSIESRAPIVLESQLCRPTSC